MEYVIKLGFGVLLYDVKLDRHGGFSSFLSHQVAAVKKWNSILVPWVEV